jgi:arginine repressor
MPKKAEKQSVKRAIANYVQTNGVTSTREIALGVADTIGYQPSTATVSDVLKELGYISKRPSFWSMTSK